MNKEVFIQQITSTLHKKSIISLSNYIDNSSFSITDLIDMTFHPNQKIGFRSAWILEHVLIQNSASFLPHLPYFLEKFPLQQNPSAKRHFSKITSLITSKKNNKLFQPVFTTTTLEPIIESCFEWLIDEQTNVAVKVHCLQTLANLAPQHLWIKDTLTHTMEHLIGIESYAFFARVKQIRKQLAKIK